MIPMVLARPAPRLADRGDLHRRPRSPGALLGYFIGWGLFETVGRPVLDFYGKGEDFDAFAVRYNDWGAWAVLIAGITPFPFKVITIASGATGLSLPGLHRLLDRRAGPALLPRRGPPAWQFGPPIRDFIERRLGLVFTLFCVILVGGFALVRYL